MTAINPGLHTRPLSDSSDSLLRFGLRVDGTLCSLTGLLMAFTLCQLFSRQLFRGWSRSWLCGNLGSRQRHTRKNVGRRF